jgi:putative peptide zinc metalloprotease protein
MAVNQSNPQALSKQLGKISVGARNDLEVSRHVFLGETSYIIRDPVTFDGHNLSPTDYEIFTNLTDDRPLKDVFQQLAKRGVVDQAQEESFYGFVVELQKRNLLSLPVTDSEPLYHDFEKKSQAKSKGLLMKLLFLRVPLGCPDRILKSTYHLAAGFFTKSFFIAWLCGLLAAMFAIGTHWSEFTSNLGSVMAVQNLPTMLAVMAGLKLWHELGHGYACRHYGVSVPNAGILLMLGTPLAFMDATGSWSLSNRWHRQVINLAGMYFELMISIIAAFVWVMTEESFIKSVAHFALIISSVTTIAFNINPLMKYDGYFVLADLLGIPNLKTRSAFTVQCLAKRVFFQLPMPPAKSKSLQSILVVYGISAGIYRITLTLGIAALISLQVWIVGILIGAYYLLASFGGMLKRLATYLIWSKEIENQRRLAIGYLLLIAVFVPSAVTIFPLAGRVQARGVLQSSNLAVVHCEHGGVVKSITSKRGSDVGTGTELVELENLDHKNQFDLKRAELDGLLTKYRRYRGEDLVMASKTEKQILQAKFELDSMGDSESTSKIVSPISGVVFHADNQLNVGQYIEPGGEICRVGGDGWIIKAVANETSLADIRPEIGDEIHCRFLSHSKDDYTGIIRTVSASGNKTVPFKALTHLANGFIPVAGESLEVTEPFFEMEIELTPESPIHLLKNGMVCEIRFQSSRDTLGRYLYRSLLRFYNQVKLSY